MALYLQYGLERSKSFAPAIAFFQKVNLPDHLPTQSPAVNMVRQTVARKFGLTPNGRKEPFTWAQVVAFAHAYGVNCQKFKFKFKLGGGGGPIGVEIGQPP